MAGGALERKPFLLLLLYSLPAVAALSAYTFADLHIIIILTHLRMRKSQLVINVIQKS